MSLSKPKPRINPFLNLQVAKAEGRPWPLKDMRGVEIIKLSTEVREAIWFLINAAQTAINEAEARASGNPPATTLAATRTAGRLQPRSLGHDDGPGYSQIELDPDHSSIDVFEARVLREALLMAYKRVKPSLPAPSEKASAEMRVLIGRLDVWLNTPTIDRLASLDVIPDGPPTT